jgi:isoleucyl-tRNA synthetase
MFKKVEPKVNFPQIEEEILAYWKKNKIFEKSVESRPADKPWTFLDGPPFITGLPHYGSLLSSIPKDIFPRFWTMKGYRVRRVWGWDCHGLPAENKVENKLGIERKKDIEEKIGIKRFIDECKLYVQDVSSEWEWYIDHIGRWVDFKNAYKTMDLPYMESVMWVFKSIYDKGYIYKGLRVSLYCPHCATPISNFEVAMDADNYKEIIDPAATYKYELADEPGTYILAWSTTPWNKLVTPALAVNPELMYIKIEQNGERYILAETTKEMLKDDTYKIIDQFKGTELVGKKFVPHYDFYEIEPGKKAFEIIGGDFVTADEGTGVVTIAAYGEEDLVAMKANNIQIVMHLDEEGTIKPDVPKFGGMYYLKANKLVNQDLTERGLMYKEYEYPHNVPLCWRCHTRLYYAPQDAWYVDIQKLKKEMAESNEKVNWYPNHFKHGRFLKSLENAPDWNISRSRYWGSPVPVWECECGERFVPGSIRELEEASGQKVTDLHKPEIDEITVPCKKCGKKIHRVPEVLDSWSEAGSATFAERHYPFEEKENLKNFFPPDFIGEYTGQIRAWFYVLHVIANALQLRDDGQNFLAHNVLVEGVILGTDGRKMSKNYGNYPDPKLMIEKYGGDALRLYLAGSPVMHGEDILISEEQYRNQVRGMLLILWNVYNFFVTYALIDNWDKKTMNVKPSQNVLDQWIMSLLNGLNQTITQDFENFDSVSAITHLQSFVDKLSTWYIRRSRDRVGLSAENKDDKNDFYSTAYTVLTTLTKLAAPLIPFVTEEIYRNLTEEESVHLTDWPEADIKLINTELEEEMEHAIQLVSIIHEFRKNAAIKVKIPIKKLSYSGIEEFSGDILEVIREETNVYEFEFGKNAKEFTVTGDTSEKNQDLVMGEVRDIIRKIQQQRKVLETTFDELVEVYLPSWPEPFEEEIKKNALVSKLIKDTEFKVVRNNV